MIHGYQTKPFVPVKGNVIPFIRLVPFVASRESPIHRPYLGNRHRNVQGKIQGCREIHVHRLVDQQQPVRQLVILSDHEVIHPVIGELERITVLQQVEQVDKRIL